MHAIDTEVKRTGHVAAAAQSFIEQLRRKSVINAARADNDCVEFIAVRAQKFQFRIDLFYRQRRTVVNRAGDSDEGRRGDEATAEVAQKGGHARSIATATRRENISRETGAEAHLRRSAGSRKLRVR